MWDKLDLTEEQKTKIEGIRKQAKEKAQSTEDRKAKREVFQQMRKDVNAVLTETQQKKLKHFEMRDAWLHGGRMWHKLDLSKEQKAKLAGIRKEAREKLAKTEDRQAKREVFGQLRKDTMATLTDEQREEVKKTFRSRGGRRGGGAHKKSD